MVRGVPLPHPRFDRRSGFSILEMLVTLALAGILLGKAIPAIGEATRATSVRGASEAFVAMVSLARAQAVEFGMDVEVAIDFDADSVSVIRGGLVTDAKNFADQYGVDLYSARSSHTICYTARGYADPTCNPHGGGAEMYVVHGDRKEHMDLLSMGQVVR